ncbi:MAG: hypothetical protein WCG93_13045 [Paludibacter sp.]
MKPKSIILLYCCMFSMHATSQKVTKTILRKGNVYVQSGKNSFSQISKLGCDTLPILSNDKKFVIFLRHLPEKYDYVTQIVRVDIATTTETVLVRACTDNPRVSTPISYANSFNYPFSCLGSIEKIFLSPNNQRIYFQAEAWTVSAAIHYYDMATTKIHFFSSGSISCVFSNGMLDIEITGNEGNGRYWQHFLFDTNGKKITPALGEKTY